MSSDTPSTAAKSPKRFTTPSIRRKGGSFGVAQVVMLLLPLAATVAMLLTQVSRDDLMRLHQLPECCSLLQTTYRGRRRLQPPPPSRWSTGLCERASRRGCAVAHTAGK